MAQYNYANPFADLQTGRNYAQGVIDQGAQQQAGNLLAQDPNTVAAAKPLFQTGQLEAGSKVQTYQADQQKQAVADHLAFLGKAADYLTQIPDDGTQSARKQALYKLTPQLQQMGYKPQDIQQLQGADLSDQALGLFKTKLADQLQIIAGDNGSYSAVNKGTGELVHRYDAPGKVEYKDVKPGDTLLQVGGPSAPTAAPAPPVAAPAAQPRGVRDNNPLNLQPLAEGQWAGQTGTDGRYATFATPEAGMAAADKNLQSYATHHGINTISGIITRWAPPSENDTAAYIKTVAADLGVDPNAKLDLSSPQVRQAVLGSMSKVELGKGPAPAQAAAPPTGPQPAGGAKVLYTAAIGDAEEQALTPDAVQLLAGKFLANGQLPPMGMGKAGNANRTAILNEATKQAKALGLDANDLIAGTAGVKATGQALSKLVGLRSQITASEQTVLKNADFALTLAPKGGGPTGSPVLNRWIQAGRKQVAGDPDVAAFDAALGTVADEYAKVMTSNTGSGGQSSDSSRQEAYRRLNSAMSQGQLQSVIGAMKTEMANRVQSLNEVEGKLRSDLRNGPNGPPAQAAPAPAPAAPPKNRPPLSAIFGR